MIDHFLYFSVQPCSKEAIKIDLVLHNATKHAKENGTEIHDMFAII